MPLDFTVLTPEEHSHLIECDVPEDDKIIDMFNEQAFMRKNHKIEPCWTCKNIARKLGVLKD